MERNRQYAPRGSEQSGTWDDAVASRRAALEALESTLLRAPDAGPVLLTGEAGAGKSWLRRALVDRLPADWRPAVVAVSPVHDAIDFLTLTLERLGAPVAASDRAGALRIAAARILEDDAHDGRRPMLVVEDAHHAAPAVWAEIEALCDGLGAAGGFGAVVLIGRTELARRLASRALRGVADRLSKHAHLLPLDVDEASRLLVGLDAEQVERLHRDAAGNPRRLLALAGAHVPRRLAGPGARPLAPSPKAEAPPSSARPTERLLEVPPAPVVRADRESRFEIEAPPSAPSPTPVSSRAVQPPLLPSRPPIRVEEGLIEVGWDGGLEEDEDEADSEAETSLSPVGEPIEDHCAALQAWSEWARNRDRLGRGSDVESEDEDEEGDEDETATDEEVEALEALAAAVDLVDMEVEEAVDEADADAEAAGEESVEETPLGSGMRAENPHEHAPYSQLFTRLRQSSS